jgi:hypothetical protein
MTIYFEHLEESFRNLWLKGFWMKKYIRIWVTVKRVTDKIRSAQGPLSKDHENWGNLGFLAGVELDFWNEFLECGSEKGRSRKSTENRVTRWRIKIWGNFEKSRCFTKRIYLGKFKNGFFWGCGRDSTWELWGGGTLSVQFVRFGGILLESFPEVTHSLKHIIGELVG